MRSTVLPAACLLAAAAAASPLHAEMMIGGYGPSTAQGNPLRRFSADAQGDDAPIGQIAGPDTQLYQPAFGVYEPDEGVVYVSDFDGRAIRVYSATATGNAAPIRVINPSSIAQTRANAPVSAHDELGVIVSNCCIATFPLHADGNDVSAIRAIDWGGSSNSTTRLYNPNALTYLPGSDEYAVIDNDPAPPQATRLVFHARTANGNVAPTRLLTGAGVAHAVGLAHDRATHQLFVLRQAPPDVNDVQHGSIAVFDEGASGDAQPLTVIEGEATQLDLIVGQYWAGLGFDPYTSRLMASSNDNSGNAALNRVILFDYAAGVGGNIAPVRQLQGSNVSPYYPGTPFGVPAEIIFRSGFEPAQHAH